MQCALSGEAPQTPAVSTKSGNVFERRLVEAYITENGKDPISGEEMTIDDLIDLKTDRTVRPRPPTFTSIPSLLSAFQNEWDALVLDAYTTRQQLTTTRQELSTALYQHDAAIRVIARLTQERDEARSALSQVTAGQGTSNGDAMQVDSKGLSEELVTLVEATQTKLSKTRKKRPIPEEWATEDMINSFKAVSTSELAYQGVQSLAVNNDGLAIIGGAKGNAGIFSINDNAIKYELHVDGAITDAVFCDGDRVALASSTGAVKIFQGETGSGGFTAHAGSVNGLAVHPCGSILASVGADKSFAFYDISSNTLATQVYTECALSTAAFHPDGHLFATGGVNGKVKIYITTSLEVGAEYDCGDSVENIVFSENGFWFATTTKNSTSITIFDIRKEGEAAKVKTIDTGSKITSIKWDYSGQFLATADASGVTVQQYSKASKSWSEPLRSATPSSAIAWGQNAKSLVTVRPDGTITILGS